MVAIGTLGLTFSYTKAFQMKNEVIAAIEEYEGNINHAGCKKQIDDSAQRLGYSPITDGCPTGYELGPDKGYYCYRDPNPTGKTTKITVMVQADISFPLMKRIVGFSLFKVTGDTREIKRH